MELVKGAMGDPTAAILAFNFYRSSIRPFCTLKSGQLPVLTCERRGYLATTLRRWGGGEKRLIAEIVTFPNRK